MNNTSLSKEEILTLAKEAYETEFADFPIIAENCALFVIDMQTDFITPNLTVN